MSTTISIDDFFSIAEEKYGDLVIPGADGNKIVALLPLLRLSSEDRKALAKLTAAQEPVVVVDEDGTETTLEPEEQDYVALLQGVIRLLADNKVGAEKLLERIGDRLDVLKTIQETWQEKTQAGEASPSSN